MITYSDRATWLTGVTNVFTADFANAPPGITVLSNATGITQMGMQFVGYASPTVYNLVLVNPTVAQPYYQWGSGAFLRGEDYSPLNEGNIRITLPAGGVTAVGLDLMAGNASSMQVRVNGTNTYTVPTFASPTRAFFGVTSDTPIQYVEVLTPAVLNGYPMIDNISRADVAMVTAETPEPGALGVAGLGVLLVMLGWKRRRQHRLLQRLAM